MHEFWTILITNLTCTRLQNHTNTMVNKHGEQAFEVMVIVLLLLLLLFDVVPTSAHSSLFLDKWFVQIC